MTTDKSCIIVSHLNIVGYSNALKAGDPGHVTIGYCNFVNDNLVTWV